jgi:hypothetical protein
VNPTQHCQGSSRTVYKREMGIRSSVIVTGALILLKNRVGWTCQNYLGKFTTDSSRGSEVETGLAALTGGKSERTRDVFHVSWNRFHSWPCSSALPCAAPCRAYGVFIIDEVGLLTRMKVQTRWKLAWDAWKLGHPHFWVFPTLLISYRLL